MQGQRMGPPISDVFVHLCAVFFCQFLADGVDLGIDDSKLKLHFLFLHVLCPEIVDLPEQRANKNNTAE